MKSLYLTTAVVETGTGLALLTVPSLVVELLLGVALDSPASIILGRVTGAALIALGLACWFTHGNQPAPGLILAILLYNILVASLLGFAGVGDHLVGYGLWPAVVLHLALAIWCVTSLRQSQATTL